MAVEISDDTPVTGRADLIAWMEAGIKTKDARRVGTEHEKFIVRRSDHVPAPYEPNGIADLLENYAKLSSATRIFQDEKLIGLSLNQAAISLEPGGQFELSGAPFFSLHEMSDELDRHLATVRKAAEPLGLSFAGFGFQPLTSLKDMPRMPKRRYDIMRNYMPKVGTCGLNMMHRSSTVQANLDFTSEENMIDIFRVGMALQPVVSALFAASPFMDGKPSGYKTIRPYMWSKTDPDRTGILNFVFDGNMGFARYVDWALDVPMYFVKRGDIYHDVTGVPFRALLEGRVPQLPQERATFADWANHLGTLFPEVRLKHFIEMRGADSGPADHVKALPSLWLGLLYDDASLAAAKDLIASWAADDVNDIYEHVSKQGFSATIAGRTALDVARDIVVLADEGLRRRNLKNSKGESEQIYLDVLKERVASGRTLADDML
ncbi:MAG: glutamate--cysteine ligase, partial [Pseudomonadota bacterium]